MTTTTEFIWLRQNEWNELEQLLARTKTSRSLGEMPEDISRFAELFRNICNDLARARSLNLADDLIVYLNSLASRSHNIFYAAPYPKARCKYFFLSVFPSVVRRNKIYVASAFFLFFGALLTMVAFSYFDDQILYQFVPPLTLQQFEKMYQAGVDQGRNPPENLKMAGFYLRHNTSIAFQCFGSGIFFGLGSIFVLIFNGLLIGAVVGYLAQTPYAINLLSFGIGHGPFELTAICLAGAAGIRLGMGFIIPGKIRRIASLRLAAIDAAHLILGSASLLAGAALIEGFFSPSTLPRGIKFLFGALCSIFLFWYLVLYQVDHSKGENRQGVLSGS